MDGHDERSFSNANNNDDNNNDDITDTNDKNDSNFNDFNGNIDNIEQLHVFAIRCVAWTSGMVSMLRIGLFGCSTKLFCGWVLLCSLHSATFLHCSKCIINFNYIYYHYHFHCY